MMLRETITQGWISLMRNRTRSLLTMGGITWGLVSVVLLLAYGEDLGKEVLNAFLGIGNNVVMFWEGQTSMQAGGERAGQRVRFKFDDLQAIRDEVPIVKAVSGEYDDQEPIKHENRVITVQSKFIEMPYGKMRRLDIAEGRYFEDADFTEERRVMIMGPKVAKRVFQGAPALNQVVTINGMSFTIVGVLKDKIQDSSNNGPDIWNVFIPFPQLKNLHNDRDPEMIVFQPIDPAMHVQAKEAVRAVLARRHHFNPKDEKATPDWDTIEDSADIMGFTVGLELILGFIGALTLGVGGVGVMNIMLVSVTERTREIGLRKAIGARPRHLLIQFLSEAIVLTFAGGLAGVVLSIIIAHLIPPMPLYSDLFKTANHEGDIVLRTSTLVMSASFAILALVGITSGIWPAMKAAKMNPIEALRYE